MLSLGVFLSIDTVVDLFYRYYFETRFLAENPNAQFALLIGDERLQFDKHFLKIIWGVIISMGGVLAYQDFRLWKLSRSDASSRQELFSVFFFRTIAYMFMFVAMPMSLLVFDKSYAETISFVDKLILASFVGIMINSMALIPYLAQNNIEKFFSGKDVLLFNAGTLVVLTILLALGVNQYMAPAVSALLMGMPFFKKVLDSWKMLEEFFQIKGKTIFEMF